MTQPTLKKRYTPAEYYELEHVAEYKSDYYDGEIFDMSGCTYAHSLITSNVGGELRQRLKGNKCQALESNMRVKVAATGLRTYPDVAVYCEDVQFDDEDPRTTTALNPTLLVEVLSKSTETYDRGLKALHYRQIPTLQTYLFVAQHRPSVEVHTRQPNGDWLISEIKGIEAVVPLTAIGIDLPVAEIYARVKFVPQTQQ